MKSKMKTKRAMLGLSTVKIVVLSLLTLAIVFIATLLALNTLSGSGLFNTATSSGNASSIATSNIIGNVSVGGSTFFSYVPTFMILLAVTVIIMIIAVVIVAVSSFGGSTESL